MSACTGSEAPVAVADDVTSPNELPRFVAATESFAELVGTTFDAASLPVELGGGVADPLAGSIIINTKVDDDGERTEAMHWFVGDDHANVAVSELVSSTGAANPEWSILTAWRLELGADMVVTVGTTVCAAPVHTYDWQNGEFVAVVNRDQNTALGAWTMTRTGPTPYAELDALVCERFVP